MSDTLSRGINFNCLEDLKNNDIPTIIFALTEEAEAILLACNENGINVTAFCDNEIRKTKKKFCDLEVIYTPELPNKFPDARFIIGHHTLEDCTEQLSDLGYTKFYSPLQLLENFDASKYSYRTTLDYMRKKIANAISINRLFFDETKTYIRSLDIVITTKCSMKCESCANLMQYYIAAKNTDENIIKAVERVSNNLDHISEYRIIGGEPLMNKNWATITNNILDQNQSRSVYIYTNATICPKEEDLKILKGKNVHFYITDYDDLSKNMTNMTNILKKFDFPFYIKPAGNWVDCSSIRKHNRTPERLRQVFKECCAKFLYTILNGKLYTCPFIANAANLKAIPDNKADYVDLLEDISDENLKLKIKKLVKMKNFFPGCNFCDGRPHDPSKALEYAGKGLIKAGKQVSRGKTLSYVENL